MMGKVKVNGPGLFVVALVLMLVLVLWSEILTNRPYQYLYAKKPSLYQYYRNP